MHIPAVTEFGALDSGLPREVAIRDGCVLFRVREGCARVAESLAVTLSYSKKQTLAQPCHRPRSS